MSRKTAFLVGIILLLGMAFILIALGVPTWLRYLALVAAGFVWWRYRWITWGRKRYHEIADTNRECRRKRPSDEDPKDPT